MIHKYCSSFASYRTPPSAFADTSPGRGGLLRPLILGYLWNFLNGSMYYFRDAFPSPYLGLSLKCSGMSPLSMAICVSVPLFGVISKIGEPTTLQCIIREFPSPYLGLSLKFYIFFKYHVATYRFPSPYLGLSLKSWKIIALKMKHSVSVPLFGVISKIDMCHASDDVSSMLSFRPLIWGYL